MKPERLVAALALCYALYSCERHDDIPAGPEENFRVEFHDMESVEAPASIEGTYILNNGNWGSNDANVGIYDPASKSFAPKAFYAANQMNLGDLGQDIIGVGDAVYIAVNGSKTVFATDRSMRLNVQINAFKGQTRLSPRCLASYGSKLYVTYYEGYVFEIDESGKTFRAATVGNSPEGLAVAGGCLYVADSGGALYPDYEKTVSVVSLETFTEISTIEVNPNPIKVEASSDGSYVYVSSFGDYAANPAKLQVITTVTGAVSDLYYASVSAIAASGDILYILCGGYDADWKPLPGTIYRHDMKNNQSLGTFMADGTVLADAYSISVARDGYVYVGCSDYVTNGDVYVFTPEGKFHDRFDSQGLNPLEAY